MDYNQIYLDINDYLDLYLIIAGHFEIKFGKMKSSKHLKIMNI